MFGNVKLPSSTKKFQTQNFKKKTLLNIEVQHFQTRKKLCCHLLTTMKFFFLKKTQVAKLAAQFEWKILYHWKVNILNFCMI